MIPAGHSYAPGEPAMQPAANYVQQANRNYTNSGEVPAATVQRKSSGTGVIQLFDPFSWGAMGMYALGALGTYGAALAYHHFTKEGPSERYNRKKHYGRTPTKADRKHFGASSSEVVDHDRPLVERYYEGQHPWLGTFLPWFYKPGYAMTKEERFAEGSDRSYMGLQDKKDSHKQGGHMSAYSRRKRKEHGL